MMRIQRWMEAMLAFVLLIAVFFPASLFAQIDTGGITGTVTDPAGAVVPGATVILTNTATAVAQTMKSTSTGTYSFSGVRPGTYDLRAAAPGFETFIDQGEQIHVQQISTVDVHLVTGTVSQHVTVTAAAPLLQAENAAVGQTITTEAVNDLPLQTRDWASLAQLSACVATAPVGNPSGDSGSSTSAYFSVNGVNLWQNDFRLNGINDNIEMYGGSSVGSNAAITPPRCHSGIQAAKRRLQCRVWTLDRSRHQRGDQIRDQQLSRKCVGVFPERRFQRGPLLQPGGREETGIPAEPVWRNGGRPHL